MRSIVQMLLESEAHVASVIDEDASASVTRKLKQLKDTGWQEDFDGFNEAELEVLKQTVSADPPGLYRGMSFDLIKLEEDKAELIRSLKQGDAVPESLLKKWNIYASYTPDLNIAMKYAMNGDLGTVFFIEKPSKGLICQCERYESGDTLIDTIIQADKEFLVDETKESPIVFSVRHDDQIDDEVRKRYNDWKVHPNRYTKGLFQMACRKRTRFEPDEVIKILEADA